jgi:hypothetical protein
MKLYSGDTSLILGRISSYERIDIKIPLAKTFTKITNIRNKYLESLGLVHVCNGRNSKNANRCTCVDELKCVGV